MPVSSIAAQKTSDILCTSQVKDVVRAEDASDEEIAKIFVVDIMLDSVVLIIGSLVGTTDG